MIALDGTMLFRKEVLLGVEPLLGALRSPAWRDAMRGFLQQSYLPTDDQALLAAELAALERMPQHVVAAVPEQFLAWDAEAALCGLTVPLLYVDASQMTDLERLAEIVPSVPVARTVGVGHVQLIAHPRQAVAAIEGFLAANGRPPVDNRAPVLALFDAVEAGELDRIDDLVSADFVDHGAPPGMVPPGPEGYRTVFRMLKGALGIRYELLDLVAEGESVMGWVRCTGRHVAEFAGIPPTGREFAFEAMHRYRVEDGVIREHHAVRDDLTLFRQLGLVPDPARPSGGPRCPRETGGHAARLRPRSGDHAPAERRHPRTGGRDHHRAVRGLRARAAMPVGPAPHGGPARGFGRPPAGPVRHRTGAGGRGAGAHRPRAGRGVGGAPLCGRGGAPRRAGARRTAGGVVSPHEEGMGERVGSLEAILVEKGYVHPETLDAIVTTYEEDVGPRNGAKVVARSWVDPAYRERLFADATAAIAELGFGGRQGEHMIALANTPDEHHLVVCTCAPATRGRCSGCRLPGTSRRPTARAR